VGAEANCALRENGARHTGRALIETDELIFRGADGYRVALPLRSLRNIRASGGELLLETSAGQFAIELGAKAESWAERIRSPKGLLDKLDLKPVYNVAVVGVSDAAFENQLAQRTQSIAVGKAPRGTNVVFLWADTAAALKKLSSLTKSIARDGAIWVIHPKGSASKVKDTDIFAAGKKLGLTATKVARFSETHTAEKLVIPLAKR